MHWKRRGDSSATQPSFYYALCTPLALYAFSLRSKRLRCDSIIYEQKNHDASAALLALYLRFSAFMLLSMRLNYALLIICQHPKHFITRFSRFLVLLRQKQTGELHSQAWSGGFFHPIWTAAEVCKTPPRRLQLTKLLLPPPSRAPRRSPKVYEVSSS